MNTRAPHGSVGCDTPNVSGWMTPPHAVRRLTSERQLAVAVAIEPRAPRHQLANVARPLVDEDAHGRLVAETVAGAHRVRRMQRRAVVGAHGRGDPALRVAGIALGGIGFGQDEHAAGRRERDRRAQPRDPAADDDEVCRIGRSGH